MRYRGWSVYPTRLAWCGRFGTACDLGGGRPAGKMPSAYRSFLPAQIRWMHSFLFLIVGSSSVLITFAAIGGGL